MLHRQACVKRGAKHLMLLIISDTLVLCMFRLIARHLQPVLAAIHVPRLLRQDVKPTMSTHTRSGPAMTGVPSSSTNKNRFLESVCSLVPTKLTEVHVLQNRTLSYIMRNHDSGCFVSCDSSNHPVRL